MLNNDQSRKYETCTWYIENYLKCLTKGDIDKKYCLDYLKNINELTCIPTSKLHHLIQYPDNKKIIYNLINSIQF